ncbi:MAG: AAA family ATPase [Pseudomonadota bacterium]
MKASSLRLIQFRGATDLLMNVGPGLTLLVGVNGAGKTTVLDALAIMFSWAAARLRSPNSSGRRIIDADIQNAKNFSSLELNCRIESPGPLEISWRLGQTRKGRNPDLNSSGTTLLRGLSEWANRTRDRIGRADSRTNIPLFVSYPVNRSVLDIPLRIRKSHVFDIVEAYDGAFTVGANFRAFFEWFRNREDIENESYRDSGQLIEDVQLSAVRRAISAFLPEVTSITVKRSPLRMEVEKDGRTYRVEQMSDGEKCMLALVGDLARRLAIANPDTGDPLQGEGVVLIDEIDLHLHPAWQRRVVRQLPLTFPNCQFIVSTHSPQIFGEVAAQDIRRLTVDSERGVISTTPAQALGLDSCEILQEHMGTPRRNQEVDEALADIFQLIDVEDYWAARKRIRDLRNELNGGIPELVRAEALIAMLEPDEGTKE